MHEMPPMYSHMREMPPSLTMIVPIAGIDQVSHGLCKANFYVTSKHPTIAFHFSKTIGTVLLALLLSYIKEVKSR